MALFIKADLAFEPVDSPNVYGNYENESLFIDVTIPSQWSNLQTPGNADSLTSQRSVSLEKWTVNPMSLGNLRW